MLELCRFWSIDGLSCKEEEKAERWVFIMLFNHIHQVFIGYLKEKVPSSKDLVFLVLFLS